MSQVIHRVARLACSPERAFAFFTEPALLAGWLCAEAMVEPRLGGAYELFWDLTDRAHDCTVGCRITAWEPGRLVAFDWRGARHLEAVMNAVDPLTHVTAAFFAVSGGSEVHLLHSGWRESSQWDQARAFFENSWSLAFSELEHQARA